MVTISLKPFFKQGKEQLGIWFENNVDLDALINSIKKARWSKTHHCWYLPLSKENYVSVVQGVNNSAKIDSILLKEYLEKRNKILRIKESAGEKPALVPASNKTYGISDENLSQLIHMVETMQLSGKSENTIKTYKNEFIALLQILKNRNVNTLTREEIRRYISYCSNELQLSANTLNSRFNSLKFYFEKALQQENFFSDLPRPLRPTIFPDLLTEKEIGRLFNAVKNKKHKAILFTAYSAGLKIIEVSRLKLTDIDSDRMQLSVPVTRGEKSRQVLLSPIVLDVLRMYIRVQKPRPIKYLFEGAISGTAYSTRSVQKIFENAKKMAGIHSKTTFQGLRQSFATHLLEKGVEVKYIQELLGHFNLRITERYLGIAKEKLVSIKSPFGEIWQDGEINK
ncbi:MAG: site-specific integrase [Rhizobacter sp.]|nr:site-specific integrase [Ferruginibacter sp.]